MSDQPAADRPVRRVSIGPLLRALEPDFPGITASKIRFLEDQGLVHPERTASGYRKYSAQDLERLQAVLRDRQGARAIINGQSLRVGERLADAQVVEIRAQSVLIERQGSREWLRLAAPLVQPSR